MNNEDLLIEFEKITDRMLAIIIDEDTDEVIRQIEIGLAQRATIIERIVAEAEEDNAEIKARIALKDHQLQSKFMEVKLSISGSISSIVKEKSLSSLKKKAHRGYLTRGHQNDGYFIDKKK